MEAKYSNLSLLETIKQFNLIKKYFSEKDILKLISDLN